MHTRHIILKVSKVIPIMPMLISNCLLIVICQFNVHLLIKIQLKSQFLKIFFNYFLISLPSHLSHLTECSLFMHANSLFYSLEHTPAIGTLHLTSPLPEYFFQDMCMASSVPLFRFLSGEPFTKKHQNSSHQP